MEKYMNTCVDMDFFNAEVVDRNQSQTLKSITAIRSQMEDGYYIRHCIELAKIAIGHTYPKPMAGCVIVNKKGEIVGEGFHPKAGQPYAELPSSSQPSKRHSVGNENYVHELQKIIEDMKIRLETEKVERLRIEAESQKLEEKQAMIEQQLKTDRETFHLELAKVRQMVQGHVRSDCEDPSPSLSS